MTATVGAASDAPSPLSRRPPRPGEKTQTVGSVEGESSSPRFRCVRSPTLCPTQPAPRATVPAAPDTAAPAYRAPRSTRVSIFSAPVTGSSSAGSTAGATPKARRDVVSTRLPSRWFPAPPTAAPTPNGSAFPMNDAPPAAPGRAECVELSAYGRGDRRKVTGVEPHAAEPGAGDPDGGLDAGADVVGVHEQGGVGAEALDLCAEGVFLCVVQQRPRMRCRAHRRDAPLPPGLEVARRAEPGDEGRTGRGDGGHLRCSARAHLSQRSLTGGHAHARGGGRDGRVVVEHAQREGLQHHGISERALDGEDGGAGEVQLPLAVAVNGTGEPIVLEVLQRLGIHDSAVVQESQLIVAEAEIAQQREKASCAGHDAESPPTGEPPGEELEDARPRCGAVTQCCAQHREFVSVCEQRRRRGHALSLVSVASATWWWRR